MSYILQLILLTNDNIITKGKKSYEIINKECRNTFSAMHKCGHCLLTESGSVEYFVKSVKEKLTGSLFKSGFHKQAIKRQPSEGKAGKRM